ncbi:UNVERIFIED_CONTAM: hypothetical protein PYX00_004854 [Menopon gallinae]
MTDTLPTAGSENDAEAKNESPKKNRTLSTSTSSFEALDPHDPNISKLANTMFQKCSEFLLGELTSTQEDYKLLENMNRVAIRKYSDMKQIAGNIAKCMKEVDEKYKALQPYLEQIDQIEDSVNKLEQAAYKLDAYSRRLENQYKMLVKK